MASLLKGMGFDPEPAHVWFIVDSGNGKGIPTHTSLFINQYHSTSTPNSLTTTDTIQSE
jgi:hypothetical protein